MYKAIETLDVVTVCNTEIDFNIYYDFRCSNAWVLCMDITSVCWFDTILYILNILRYIIIVIIKSK